MFCGSQSHFSFREHVEFFQDLACWKKALIVGGVTIGIAVHVAKIYKSQKRKKLRNKWNSTAKDVVVLHCTAQATTVPNASPFVLKLETYLRMSGIQYEIDTEMPFGPKSKFPWITLNGKDYTDSELIMDFLGEKFKKDFSSKLSVAEKAVARSMSIMTDEHLFLSLVWWRLLHDLDYFMTQVTFPRYFKYLVPYKAKQWLWISGIGRHTDQEIITIMKKDLTALSNYLGTKPFMMGKEPTEVDCSIFGLLAQFLWTSKNMPLRSLMEDECSNLKAYCLRMKDTFWADWDDRLLKL